MLFSGVCKVMQDYDWYNVLLPSYIEGELKEREGGWLTRTAELSCWRE